jgi:hypothetical protein
VASIRRSERGGKSAYLDVGIWYDQQTDQIHMTVRNSGWFHTTVDRDPTSKRGHPNLFAKLSRALKEAGAPHPEAPEPDGES